MLFISSKKLFSFARYSNFCISTFPPSFFLPVSHLKAWSKINLRHQLSKKELHNTFCSISWEGKQVWHWNFGHWYTTVLKKGTHIFMEKSFRKCASKALVPDPFFILVNNPKNSNWMQEILLKIRHFERGSSKTFKKVVNFIISFQRSPFGQSYQN